MQVKVFSLSDLSRELPRIDKSEILEVQLREGRVRNIFNREFVTEARQMLADVSFQHPVIFVGSYRQSSKVVLLPNSSTEFIQENYDLYLKALLDALDSLILSEDWEVRDYPYFHVEDESAADSTLEFLSETAHSEQVSCIWFDPNCGMIYEKTILSGSTLLDETLLQSSIDNAHSFEFSEVH